MVTTFDFNIKCQWLWRTNENQSSIKIIDNQTKFNFEQSLIEEVYREMNESVQNTFCARQGYDK